MNHETRDFTLRLTEMQLAQLVLLVSAELVRLDSLRRAHYNPANDRKVEEFFFLMQQLISVYRPVRPDEPHPLDAAAMEDDRP